MLKSCRVGSVTHGGAVSPNVCGLGPPHADCHHQQQGRLHTLRTTPHISALDNHSVNTNSTSTITATPTPPTRCTLHHYYKLLYRQFTKHGNVYLLPGLCTHHGQRCVCVCTRYNVCMIGLRTNLAGVSLLWGTLSQGRKGLHPSIV